MGKIDIMQIKKLTLSDKISVQSALLIGSALISLSILISGGVVKLKNSPSVLGQATIPTTTPGVDQGQIATVSGDDDPVLGSSSAPITIIEFSDYECPYCKRHFDQTYGQLKTDYIDTGKVKLIYRDLPLSFHEPEASKEALAANCSRDQGGDSVYFKFHDEVFKKTKSNGEGLGENGIYQISKDLGLNQTDFKNCIDNQKYAKEIKDDVSEASKIGAGSTPSFYIGKSSPNNVIQGIYLRGAQPFDQFKKVIDSLI